MARGKFVGYLRVSTEKQGLSGLGIEAQRKAIDDYLNGGKWELLAEYVEIESGKRSDRPELAKALAHSKATGATLVIAKLDRLSRNVAFISNLMESGVDFVAADMPMANRLTVHVLAAVAEHEREMIAQRTTAALAAAKVRGVKLGNPNGARALRGLGNAHAVTAVKARADAHVNRVLPVIEAIRCGGTRGLHGIAEELNRQGILTARGGRWYATTVKNLLDRGPLTDRAAKMEGPNSAMVRGKLRADLDTGESWHAVSRRTRIPYSTVKKHTRALGYEPRPANAPKNPRG
jgi:DNA invertase Pin-like site-specific DNA recombinase